MEELDPNGICTQSFVVLYMAHKHVLRALHRSKLTYLGSEQSAPAIFVGFLSSNKNIYPPKQ